ncbi:MAG: thioredoxin family (seleno)protein [Myxococcota bacterium]
MVTGLLLTSVLTATAPHPELGIVDWERDFRAAQSESARSGRPMLVLFDEVPGCSTVRGYGERVLSHPLIKEAMETLFVPVAVFNNVGGEDRKVLNHFREATWNNPAVRIMSSDEKPLARRLYGDYSVAATARVMIEALEAKGQSAPSYLELLTASARTETATYEMYCFWSGEVALGGVDGVVKSEPGFNGGEVVRLEYDRKLVSLSDLDRVAKSARAKRVSSDRFVPSPKDDKYQLKHSLLRFVPLTDTQASRVNAALGQRANPLVHLSPGQREIYSAIKRQNGAGWTSQIGRRDFARAYRRAQDKARTVLARR